jgi:hypothetical protein
MKTSIRVLASIVVLASLVGLAGLTGSAGAASRGPSSAGYSAVILGDHPIIYYRLGELSGTTAFDSSGNSRDATYVNGPRLARPGAIRGDTDTAVGFDGVNDFAQWIPDGVVSGSFTVEAWINAFDDSGGSGGEYDFFSTRRPSEYGFDFKLTGTSFPFGNGKRLYVDVGDGSQWLAIGYETSSVPFNYGLRHWYYVAAVVTATGVTFYEDGGTPRTIPFSGTPLLYDPSHYVQLAGIGSPPIGPLYGGLDEVAMYDHALTSEQVAAHYAAGIAP